jgi:hypothetical protein
MLCCKGRKKDDYSYGPVSQLLCQTQKRRGLSVAPPDAASKQTSRIMTKECSECEKKNGSGHAAPKDIVRQVNEHLAQCPGEQLPQTVRNFYQKKFGITFEQVRIHTCQKAIQLNETINAEAFTYKNHIFFNKDKYDPDNTEGKELLEHELTHVVQQNGATNQGVQRQRKETPSACHGTNRIGNLKYRGVLEHLIIQQYYLMAVNPLAELEYFIPESSLGGGPGYADIADPISGGIYEIKFYPFAQQAGFEVAKYVAMAQKHCDALVPWHPGVNYPGAVLPFAGGREIVSWLAAPGVIAYYTRKKIRQKEPEKVPVPIPKKEREPVLRKVEQFIRRVVASGEDAYEAAKEFLKNNPDVLRYIKNIAAGVMIVAAVAIIVVTIIEDIASLGAGVLDDPASFAAAFGLVRAALAMI